MLLERKLLREKKSMTEEEFKRHEELGFQLQILLAKSSAMKNKETEKQAADEAAAAKKKSDEQKAQDDKNRERQRAENQKKVEEEKRTQEELSNIYLKENRAREAAQMKAYNKELKDAQERNKAKQKAAQEELKIQENLQLALSQLDKQWQEEKTARLKDAEMKRQELALSGAATTISLLSSIINNANAQTEEERKRQFQQQKAFEIGQTIISTIAAAQAAYRGQMSTATPDAIVRAQIAATIATVQGMARVIAIQKQQYNGGAAAGAAPAPSMNMGGGGFQRPAIPSSSTLGGGSQMVGKWDNRVYVTEGDITGTQRRVNQLRGTSVI